MNATRTVRPYVDTVTGDIRYWEIVDAAGVVLASGIATRQDAEDRAAQPHIGDTVRIYRNEIVNGRIVGRALQPGEFVIARTNRHGDWTVRHVPTGCTHDVFRSDVELIPA